MKKYILMTVVVIAVGGVGYYFLGGNKKGEAAPVGQIQRVVKVSRGNLSLTVSANGVVQPVTKIDIKSKASGIIQELNFNEGSHVRKGELLIQTDTITTRNNYDQALSDVATAEAGLKQSQNNWTRTTGLFEKGLASQQDVDAANVDLVRARSTLQRAQSSLSTASDALRDTKVRAPITGTILSKSVELGTIIASAVSNVGGGTTLATIADMDTVNIETSVDEVDIGKVKEGLRASVKADAFPDDVFPGWVLRIAPLGKTQSNVTVFTVIIQVQNLGEKLKAGMSASVDIEVFNRRDVVLVPNEALRDPRSEQGQAMMTAFNLSIPKDTTVHVAATKPEQGGASEGSDAIAKLRERMRNASSDDERQKLQQEMRAEFEKLSPEARQKFFEQMRQRFGGGGMGSGGRSARGQNGETGGGFAGGGDTPSGEGQMRMRRSSQQLDVSTTKWRIVVVKQADEFKPKLIKVGPSNFDYSEVLEGLNDGDEIQITTISRAKVAAEAMVDRMKQMSSPLGGGGGGGRGGR
ncbi:MAG TPA: efflux RND transporter periplasmic adaptor subunit [Bacteroidota bacterium]|nr:efflux RND transporter periplasmic adaptor subunit [Bacteroidota bacterium]